MDFVTFTQNRNTPTTEVVEATSKPEVENSKALGPGSTYSGAGPHGIPQDGKSWRLHPSNQRYASEPIDHNALNNPERCAGARDDTLHHSFSLFATVTLSIVPDFHAALTLTN